LSSFGDVIREASILGKRSFFYDRIYDARVKASASNATQFVLSGMPRYIVEAALIVAIAGFIMIQVSNGDIGSSAATLGIFLSGGLRLTASLLPLQSALLTINQSLPPALRALRFIDELTENPSSPPKSQEIVDDDHPLSIFVDNATFTYKGSDTETLKGISLKIQAGSQAAFIGVSGAGKSTLADLVLGLLKPTGGSVLIDNIDAAKLVESNPGLVSYVPQKPGMISGTLAENIALGINSDQINQKRLAQAIDDSHLRELIDSLPEGVNTDLGKRKDEFSGGQLQRVGLARALYCKPRLLVMDEATSALDAESENEINKALEQMRGKVTVILIAHRLNTIQRSDTVFLMEDGKITDSGTFPELLRSNSTVQNLAKLMAIDSASDLKM
jgi:ATP-binding cassette subfamily C protein